ncbi:MAG: hypothetical protein ACYDES_01665 [Acidimicrobiales bacterium]
MSALRTAVRQDIDSIDFFIRLARAPDPGAVSLFADNSRMSSRLIRR